MAAMRIGERDPEKEASWVERMKRWEGSGLGPKEYCRQHELKETQFYWWRRVLQERGLWRQRRARQVIENNPGEPPLAFAEVALRSIPDAAGPAEEHGGERLEIRVGSRYRVSVPEGFAAETLARVLSVLDLRPC